MEEEGGCIAAAEMKRSRQPAYKRLAAWAKAYPECEYQIVHPDNYLDFICIEN